MTFLVGSDNVVHAKSCRNILDDKHTVVYITKAKSHPDLRSWLGRPDIKDRHELPGILTVCGECIEDE